MAQKYLFIAISFYRNIVSRVNKALECREDKETKKSSLYCKAKQIKLSAKHKIQSLLADNLRVITESELPQ